jgi:hypothetical protein
MKTVKLKRPPALPDRERWLWENQEALASVERGLCQSTNGKVKPWEKTKTIRTRKKYQ